MIINPKFSESIQKNIDKVMLTLPDDANIALVAHADLEGVSLTTLGRLGPHGQWAAMVSTPLTGPERFKLKAEAEVRFAW